MKIDLSQPFEIIYSIFKHEYLGHLVEPYAVQQNDEGRLTLKYQNISTKNALDFSDLLHEDDHQIIQLCERMGQVSVYKQFNSKKYTLPEFYMRTFDDEKGDKILADGIRDFLNNMRAKLFLLLEKKQNVYEMAPDLRPHGTLLQFVQVPATLTLVIEKLIGESKYFPVVTCNGLKVNLQESKSAILCDSPVYLKSGHQIFKFEKHIESGKIKPFLNKTHITIPSKFEQDWYQKFVKNAIGTHNITPIGFEIKQVVQRPKVIIELYPIQKAVAVNLFNEKEEADADLVPHDDVKIEQFFSYHTFKFDNSIGQEKEIIDVQENDKLTFYVVHRRTDVEKEIILKLNELGLPISHSKCKMPTQEAVIKLAQIKRELQNLGFELEIVQHFINKNYHIGEARLNVELTEKYDWFDVKANAVFGRFKLPFAKIRYFVMNNIKEFELPDGTTAIIPDEWFDDYRDLFGLCKTDEFDEEADGKMELCFSGIIQNICEINNVKINLSARIKKLLKLEALSDIQPSTYLRASLREYQQYGLNWLYTLYEHNLGALLADDMGLGKTLQTLAFLQKRKENAGKGTVLLIVPTSLVFNWVDECKKFTPDLSIHVQTGLNRLRQVPLFSMFDIVITTYGIVRQDIEMLTQFEFEYIVFDEAQALKNPSSQIYRCALKLRARNRIALTGTPVENSAGDLWALMNLLNQGVLGSKKYFKLFYQHRIERKSDEQQLIRLRKIVSPFILRRTKSQVVKDLPERVDQLLTCMMTEAQAEYYRKAKETFRNLIIEQSFRGSGNKQILMLQGLTKLRQIANHPGMVDKTYQGGAGKMDDVMQKLLDVLEEGHKVLIFSSFKEHLNFLKQQIEAHQIEYVMLTGDTDKREEVVKTFKSAHHVNVFLITIKAGGVGLNLAEADYVFIIDPWWNPATEEQAVSRAHRIGQRNSVFVYRFITKDTIEEKIYKMQQRKQKLADDLIRSEETFLHALSESEMEELFS